jgi:hypothetical protein
MGTVAMEILHVRILNVESVEGNALKVNYSFVKKS